MKKKLLKNHNHMMYCSWDTGWDRQNFFLSFGPFFCSFTPLMILKTKTLKQWKKCLKIFCLPHLYHKRRSYDIWFLKYKVQQTIFCHFGPFLALSPPSPLPPDNLENQNFEKLKKIAGDIIILHMCTINDNHLMYGSWDMDQDGQNFFVILDCFLPFYYSPMDPENQDFENMKIMSGDIII